MKNGEARYLFQEFRWFIPVSSKVCWGCCTDFQIISKLKNISLEEYTTPNYKPVTLAFAQASGDFVSECTPSAPPPEDDNLSECSGSDSTTSTASKDWVLTSPHLSSYKKEALDRLLFLNEAKPSVPSVLNETWDSTTPVRQWQVKDYASAGIASVIHTVTQKVDDDMKIWNIVKEERRVEKYLKSSVTPSNFMKEMIRAWSAAGSPSERYQIGSLLVMQYPYR